jgi:hypothetical protein
MLLVKPNWITDMYKSNKFINPEENIKKYMHTDINVLIKNGKASLGSVENNIRMKRVRVKKESEMTQEFK